MYKGTVLPSPFFYALTVLPSIYIPVTCGLQRDIISGHSQFASLLAQRAGTSHLCSQQELIVLKKIPCAPTRVEFGVFRVGKEYYNGYEIKDCIERDLSE